MKVLCLHNHTRHLTDEHYRTGVSRNFEESIEIGKIYNIYGMCLFGGKLDYLLVNKYNKPSFHAADYFRVIENVIPEYWQFKFNQSGLYMVNAIWGYEKMVNDERHYNDLILDEGEAVSYFFEEIYPLIQDP